jgi:hypothetical protein
MSTHLDRLDHLEPRPDHPITDPLSFVGDVRSAAREYCVMGLRVLPLKPMSKEPLFKKWPERATSDPDQVDGLFPEDAPYNLGVATGRGLLVVDVDPCHGGEESWNRALAQQDALPRTATARTGSGGLHVLFRVDSESRVGCRVGLWPGVDIRGDGGQIVVSPSVHPTTEKPYEWIVHPREGIAPPPPWLLEAIRGRGKGDARRADATKDRPTKQRGKDEANEGPGNPTECRSSERRREPVQSLAVPRRRGDIPALTDEVIRDFPVPGEGQRHGNMRDAIGRLFTRLYDEQTIVEVMMGWWSHYFLLGRVRTDREGMEEDLRSCLRSTSNNPDFCLATCEEDHIAACAAIELSPLQRELLKAPIARLHELHAGDSVRTPEGGEYPGSSPEPIPCKRLTQRRERLCMGYHEECFVEALISILIYKRQSSPELTFQATNSQIARVAGLRNPAEPPSWDDQQIERLKRKYVTRPEKSAFVFELVQEVRKGGRKRGSKAGTPSEYRPTGLLVFLDAVAQSPSLHDRPSQPQSSKPTDAICEETRCALPIGTVPGHAA